MTTILREEIESQHKKAVKAWDGEKRAAIKKAKALKGKKGKDAMEQVEQEYAIKLQDLETKYSQELDKDFKKMASLMTVSDASLAQSVSPSSIVAKSNKKSKVNSL